MEALTPEMCEQYLRHVMSMLPEAHRNHIDADRTLAVQRRLFHASINVYYLPVVDKIRIHVYKAQWMQLLKGAQSAQCVINGISPYAVVEPPPGLRPYYAAGGRFLGWLERQAADPFGELEDPMIQDTGGS